MKIAQIQFAPWDKKYNFSFENLPDLKIGDEVLVETEFGLELGKVFLLRKTELEVEELEIKPILRLAESRDLEQKFQSEKR